MFFLFQWIIRIPGVDEMIVPVGVEEEEVHLRGEAYVRCMAPTVSVGVHVFMYNFSKFKNFFLSLQWVYDADIRVDDHPINATMQEWIQHLRYIDREYNDYNWDSDLDIYYLFENEIYQEEHWE